MANDLELEFKIELDKKNEENNWYDPNKGLLISLERIHKYGYLYDI